MISLKDIASACGVSVATVSKALNKQNDISDETRERIIAYANKHGYVPNAAAKALKTDRTHNIGVLFVDEANSGLTHDYFSYVLDSFKRSIEDLGYDMTFLSNNKKPGRSTYLERARFRRFDGVCIACVDFFDKEVMELISSEIPVVTIDHIFNNTTSVRSDNVGGMRDLADYVFRKGHKNIAYIHGEKHSSVTTNRIASLYRVAEEYGVMIDDNNICEAAYRDTKGAYQRTLELLDRSNPPTCIFYPDDFAALGGIRAISERGLEIPKDISVAGYDGIRISRHLKPRLTTIRQDTELIGQIAAKQLVDMIENPKTTLIQQEVVQGTLYEGESVGTPPNR